MRRWARDDSPRRICNRDRRRFISVGKNLGPHSATLQVFDDAASSPQNVAATGTGTVDMTVTPASYGFSSVKDGSEAVKVIVVHNYQTNPVSLSEGFGGPNAGDFAVTGGNCGSTLAGGGASCTYTLKLTPSIDGAESATLGVSAAGDTASPHNVSLTGTGS